MGRIPEETIEAVVAATDIVGLIDGYNIGLKRAGSAYKACCPFHSEKTPSFNVNPSRNSFHCFGCGEGGSAIGFVMKYENLPFPEAVKKLAKAAGIVIAEDVYDPKEAERSKTRRRIMELHKDATAYFHRLLLRSPLAKGAREYLKGRGISSDLAKEWKLGYAPESGAMLSGWAREAGYTETLLVDGGLLAYRDENYPGRGTYARFRHRLMFPVANDYGEVIAFSGRHIEKDQGGGKYVNSPETPVFNKSKTFYGLDRAKRPIIKANSSIIVEGQLDLITLVENEFTNVVAPLGTAFTELHAKLLARHAPECILCNDSDSAGFKASEKAFTHLAKAGVDVKVASMPPGEDPDSLIRTQGAEAFQKVIDEAKPFFDHLISHAAETQDLSSMKDRVAITDQAASLVAHLNDQIAQDTAIMNIATRLKIAPDQLRERIAEARKKNHYQEKNARERAARQTSRGGPAGYDPSTPTISAPPAEFSIRNRRVAWLCRLALTDLEARKWLGDLEHTNFIQEVPETELLLTIIASGETPSATLILKLSEAEQRYLTALEFADFPPGNVEAAFLWLQEEQLQYRVDALKAALDPGALEELMALQKMVNEVRRARSAIKLKI